MGVTEVKETSLRPPSGTSLDNSLDSSFEKSGAPSTNEKNDPVTTTEPVRSPSTQEQPHGAGERHHGLKGELQDTVEEAKEQDSAENVPEDETEYPSGMKLGLISLALCLSVFCMALVRSKCPLDTRDL